MKVHHDSSRFLVRFERGEAIPDTLVTLAKERGWMSGSLLGIGGVQDVMLAYFDLHTKSYMQIPVEGIVELISLSGNLAFVDGQPLWHMHAAVSDVKGRVTAGHLVSLKVAVTLECWITPSHDVVTRSRDEFSGLNLLAI